MPINVIENEEGYWINFDSPTQKKQAMVNVDKLLNHSGSIIDSAILAVCKEEVAARSPCHRKFALLGKLRHAKTLRVIAPQERKR
jgi:hypothetical protein